MEKITMIIEPNGDYTLKTEGFKGADCIKATAEIVRRLGTPDSDLKTAEYHQMPAKQTVKTGGGRG